MKQFAASLAIRFPRKNRRVAREIPQCWITGQAAGVAAALASRGDIAPRFVDVGALQSELLEQGVYLRAGAGQGDSAPLATAEAGA